MLENEFPNTFIWVACHVRDVLEVPETDTRAAYYGVGSLPHVRIDGRFMITGASSCYGAYLQYRAKYIERMNETGGTSPVEISNAYFVTGEDRGYVQATFELLDPATLSNPTATFFVYEEDVESYTRVTRVIRDELIQMVHVGDRVVVVKDFELGNWSLDELYGLVVLQERDGFKTIIETLRLTRVQDFALDMGKRLISIPEGSGEALFYGTLENIGSGSDSYDLSVEGFEWPADFMIAGDPNWYTSHTLPLLPGEQIDITVRVQTDDTKRVGNGSFIAESINSGRAQPISLRVFNACYALLFVDDDNGAELDGPIELPFENALNELECCYDNWDVWKEHGRVCPRRDDLNGYDAVIWQRGLVYSEMKSYNKDALIAYLDTGGSLFLSSMDFLSNEDETDTFVMEYLGVDSWTSNAGADILLGIEGDPISDGLLLPLSWPAPEVDHVDDLIPQAGVSPFFYNESQRPVGVRKLTDSGRHVVFSTVLQNAISESDPDPNNSRTVIERVLDYLLSEAPAGVEDGPLPGLPGSITARPNPFSWQTRLLFGLSPHDAAASVEVIDISGRHVKSLTLRPEPDGECRAVWNGRDSSGRPVASGVYYARLKSRDGEGWTKLVLLR